MPFLSNAQNISDADTVDMGILMRKERSWNIMLHTLGYGAGYRFGNNQTYYKNVMYDFDILEMRAPNQVKQSNQNFPNTRPYVYGKLNSLFILRAGIGRQLLLNRKPYWGGVEVRAFYYGGIDIGLAKPTYLYISYDSLVNGTLYQDHISLEKYDPEKHFPYPGTGTSPLSEIYGRGPLLSGFEQIKPYPGLYLKGGFNFEFSSLNDRIRSLEAGVTLDIFPKPVPIMAFSKADYYFITGYLSYHFGKRYN